VHENWFPRVSRETLLLSKAVRFRYPHHMDGTTIDVLVEYVG